MLTDVEIEIELEIEIEIENISILSILSILSTLSTLSTLSYLSYLPYLSTLSYLACLCLPRENRALSDGASDTGDELSSQVQDQVEEEEKMEKFWDEHDDEASEHVSPTQGGVIGKSMWSIYLSIYLIYLTYLSYLSILSIYLTTLAALASDSELLAPDSDPSFGYKDPYNPNHLSSSDSNEEDSKHYSDEDSRQAFQVRYQAGLVSQTEIDDRRTKKQGGSAQFGEFLTYMLWMHICFLAYMLYLQVQRCKTTCTQNKQDWLASRNVKVAK